MKKMFETRIIILCALIIVVLVTDIISMFSFFISLPGVYRSALFGEVLKNYAIHAVIQGGIIGLSLWSIKEEKIRPVLAVGLLYFLYSLGRLLFNISADVQGYLRSLDLLRGLNLIIELLIILLLASFFINKKMRDYVFNKAS
ncbi:hypothetical protein ACYSNR_05940 [Enterococcus sp. LJL128]